MTSGRVVIIPFLHGKLTAEGRLIEPDIEAIFERWLKRHPEFQSPDRDYRVIRGRMHLPQGIPTQLVRLTAEFSPDIADYDPTQDADLYQDFLAEDTESPPLPAHRIWADQCEAAEAIVANYGTDKAMGYLIGEKLLDFLEVAEDQPEWRAEIPKFVAKIKELFEPWQIAQFFETPRRLGPLGHTADEEGHKLLRRQVDAPENLREDARNLLLLERAREWLMD